ncbi:MAG: YkgJ family cysteine cluster protein [Spirochaetes bacterium]|nr:YkgJ family cysteine cluster protein [Spirochaetota bacterium]
MIIEKDYYAIFPQLTNLIELYRTIDDATFQVKTLLSINCPAGCGTCCCTASSNIEASIIEMLPLCIYCFKKNIYHEIRLRIAENFCPFYRPTPLPDGGCCNAYQYRPLVCRLFGFSFMKNKFGTFIPIACPTLRNEYEKKSEIISTNATILPLITAFSFQSLTIDYSLGNDRYPINVAFAKAMDYVLLKIDAYRTSQRLADRTVA